MNWKSIGIFIATLAVAIGSWGIAHDWVASPNMTPYDWFGLLTLVGSNVVSWLNNSPKNGSVVPTQPPK